MLYVKAGLLCRMQDVPTGSCVMFSAHSSTRIGFVIELNSQERGIIDPNHIAEDRREYPTIYQASTFQNEDIFLFEKARIVPDFTPVSSRFGRHNNGGISKALYINGDELILQAARDHNVYSFDLVTGKTPTDYRLSRLHTIRWRIEAPDADGDYQVVAEFSA